MALHGHIMAKAYDSGSLCCTIRAGSIFKMITMPMLKKKRNKFNSHQLEVKCLLHMAPQNN